MNSPALPSADLLRQQAAWLAPARARLLRRVAVARRSSVLDLGAGYGSVTAELVRRSGGPVVALDCHTLSLRETKRVGALATAGDGRRLPLADNVFDLVFCQCALMWMKPLEMTAAEIWRVLQPGGVLVALEPDYGGLIESPRAIRTVAIWQAALNRAGAEPLTGRLLPEILAHRGFRLQVNLLDALQPPAAERFEFLRGLPLTPAETDQVAQIEVKAGQLEGWAQLAHLPFFLITAVK